MAERRVKVVPISKRLRLKRERALHGRALERIAIERGWIKPWTEVTAARAARPVPTTQLDFLLDVMRPAAKRSTAARGIL